MTSGADSLWAKGALSVFVVVAASCGGRIEASSSTDDRTVGLARDQFVASVTAAICASVQTCCGTSGATPYSDYRQRVQAYWQTIFDHATNIGAHYDATQAARCVELLAEEWSHCADRKSVNTLSDDVCATVFSAPPPGQSPGGMCQASLDCAQGGDNPIICHNLASGTTLNGTCVAHVISDAGGICGGLRGTTLADCGAPFVCGPDQRCHAPFALGESCDILGGDTCAVGTVCNSTVSTPRCQTAVAQGGSCKVESDCENFACRGQTCRVLPSFSLSLACN